MPVDLRKLRDYIRTQLDTEQLLSLLDHAIELIPLERLPELIEGVSDPDLLIIDELSEITLLEEVRDFHVDSLAGMYYEDFMVNSKNFMDKSRGTINWIAEHGRLMDRCIQESTSGEPDQIRQAFELLFNLLDEIDECRDDIIFFADEAGAWQVGVEWDEVLPGYFTVLAAVAQPKEYAECTLKLVKSHADYNSDQYLKIALEIAKPSQRKALKASLSKA